MLQQKMKGMAMVVMAQMTKFMQKYIVLKHLWQTHNIQIQVDVISC